MNRITPRDVGRRVSVRRRLADGAPGARYTDVVGTLTAWEDGLLTVTRRDGSAVRVPQAEVEAAKTVPAPPPRGAAAAPPERLQHVVAEAWPALEREHLGGWLLQAAAGFTRRANCVVPAGDPGVPVDAALAAVESWYAARGLPTYLQIADTAGELDALLAARGWVVEARAVTRTAPLASVRERAGDPRATVALSEEFAETWLRRYGRTASGADADAVRHVLAGPPGTLFASVGHPGDTPTAVGRLVVVGRYAYIAAVEVEQGRRREGLARALMAAMADAALARGATTAVLQVEEGNAAARSLYDTLGFTDHHRYHYRTPGAVGRRGDVGRADCGRADAAAGGGDAPGGEAAAGDRAAHRTDPTGAPSTGGAR